MEADSAGLARNLLLRALGEAERGLLAPHLETIDLAERQVLIHAGVPIDRVCFIAEGIASHAAVAATGEQCGVAIVGFEGFVGGSILLGQPTSPYEVTVTTGGGAALSIPADAVLQACDQSESLRLQLLRFMHTFLLQLTQTAVSNLSDPVERRLSRWLLMNHDRLDGDEIILTHAEVGHMLGVRRASVTDALHVLEGRGLIRAKRRCITIRNRAGLRVAAGDTYGQAEADYRQLVAPFGKDG